MLMTHTLLSCHNSVALVLSCTHSYLQFQMQVFCRRDSKHGMHDDVLPAGSCRMSCHCMPMHWHKLAVDICYKAMHLLVNIAFPSGESDNSQTHLPGR